MNVDKLIRKLNTKKKNILKFEIPRFCSVWSDLKMEKTAANNYKMFLIDVLNTLILHAPAPGEYQMFD